MAVLTMGRAHVCPPSLQTPVNHLPTVRSLRSPSTTKRPFTTAACGVRRPYMRSTKVSVSQQHVTSAAVTPPGSICTWSVVMSISYWLGTAPVTVRSEEHTSELQSPDHL